MSFNASYLHFALPAKVEFGPGRIKVLPEVLVANEFQHAAFVVTPGRRRSGMLDPTLAALEEHGIEATIFDRVVENPDAESVRECVRFLRGDRPDVVIGVGGGSPLDTAKAAAVCYTNDLEDVLEIARGGKLKRRSLPTIMIPTTSGSGTEVNYWAVITDEASKEKLSVGDPMMSPYVALVDPELTFSLPPKQTLWSGLDALTHAVEAYLSAAGNWLSDMFCLGALSLVLRSLNRAVEKGKSLRARGNMALASLLAGAAMQNVGLGLVHAMSHQVSGLYDTPHGLVNALLLPHVLRFNVPKCRSKMQTVNSLVKGHRGLITWLDGTAKRHGLHPDLVQINEADIPLMAEWALGNVNVRTNPRRPELADIVELYRQSFKVL